MKIINPDYYPPAIAFVLTLAAFAVAIAFIVK